MSLKSIVPKSQTLKVVNSVNLDVPEIHSVGTEEPAVSVKRVPSVSPKEVPPKSVLFQDLSSLKGYTEKRKAVKDELKYAEFVEELQAVLSIFEGENKKYDSAMVLFVCNSAENYFSKKGSGEIKQKAVVDVCKKYYNNDEELLKSIIELLMPMISKSSMFSRSFQKLRNFFWLMIYKK